MLRERHDVALRDSDPCPGSRGKLVHRLVAAVDAGKPRLRCSWCSLDVPVLVDEPPAKVPPPGPQREVELDAFVRWLRQAGYTWSWAERAYRSALIARGHSHLMASGHYRWAVAAVDLFAAGGAPVKIRGVSAEALAERIPRG